jgi:hypothetical protein
MEDTDNDDDSHNETVAASAAPAVKSALHLSLDNSTINNNNSAINKNNNDDDRGRPADNDAASIGTTDYATTDTAVARRVTSGGGVWSDGNPNEAEWIVWRSGDDTRPRRSNEEVCRTIHETEDSKHPRPGTRQLYGSCQSEENRRLAAYGRGHQRNADTTTGDDRRTVRAAASFCRNIR